MSSISPISLGADLATLGRGVDPVYRAARSQGDPVVLPPAVILPRTAAWLNVSVAPDLTGQDTDGSGQAGSGSGQPGPGAGFAQTGQAPADAAAAPSLVASLNAQSVAASAASAVTSGQAAAQDGQPAGFGSVVQLV